MKKISKFLSLILRHSPEVANIVLDKHGYAKVSDIVSAIVHKYGKFTSNDLKELVAQNDKQRFSFNSHYTKIRANQGHSIAIDLQLEPISPPNVLYHGTKSKYLSSIFKHGLLPKNRNHVHLSENVETAKTVATRRTGNSIILAIDCSKNTDLVFYKSENDVWLCEYIPADIISIFPIDNIDL